MNRKIFSASGGLLLIGLLTLFGVILLNRSPNEAVTTFQSPLPTETPSDTPPEIPPEVPESPCLTLTDAGFVFEVDGYVQNADGTTTLTYSVTNPNKKDISYVAFGTADWTRVAPSDGMNTTLGLGEYNIEWTKDKGNPGFTSIKYETQFDGFSKGAMDTFTLVVSDFDPSVTIQIQAKAGKDRGTVEVDLSDPACDKTPPTPTPAPTDTPTETATPVPSATQPGSPLPTPTSPMPTRTPWVPPTPLAATPTAIPLSVPENNRGTLVYADFDPSSPQLQIKFIHTDEAGNVIGEPTILPLQEQVYPDYFSVSPDGRSLAGIRETVGGVVISLFDLQSGQFLSQIVPGYFFGWHPDSQHVLIRTISRQLWQINILTKEQVPLAQPSSTIAGAAAATNGQKLAYATGNTVWVADSNGSNPEKRITASDVWAWSFDSRYLIYTGEPYNSPKGSKEPIYLLWVYDMATQERQPIEGPFIYGYGFAPILSPANNQLAFIGASENPDPCLFNDNAYRADPLCKYRGYSLYIADFEADTVTRIADNAGRPSWSPDGSAIVYTKMDTNEQVDIWITYLQEARDEQITNSSTRERGTIWATR